MVTTPIVILPFFSHTSASKQNSAISLKFHSSWVFIILLNNCKKIKKSPTYRPVIHTFWKQVVQKYKKCELWPLILRHTWRDVEIYNTFWTSLVKSYHWCKFQRKRPIFSRFSFFHTFCVAHFWPKWLFLEIHEFCTKILRILTKTIKMWFPGFH